MRELIIRAFVRIFLLLFATLIKTALRVSRIIIIKKIWVCQNSKKDDSFIGSIYASSLPNSVELTASADIPKLDFITKISDTTYRSIKKRKPFKIRLIALSFWRFLITVNFTICLLKLHYKGQKRFLSRLQNF